MTTKKATKHHTSYKDLNGIYITGEITASSYGVDIFHTLNTIKQRQEDLTGMIGVLLNLKGDNLIAKAENISEILSKDAGLVAALEIMEIPEAERLNPIKAETTKMIADNELLFVTTAKNKTFSQAEQDIMNIDLAIQKVAGENLNNFSKEYKSSGEFKEQTIDKIDSVKKQLNLLSNDENIATQRDILLGTLVTLRKKSLDIYILVVNMESLRKKTTASGVDLDDFINQIRNQWSEE